MSGKAFRACIIAGVHRSGTSLFASFLKECGLDIGARLLGARRDNSNGFFEDLDFVELHNDILRKNGKRLYVPPSRLVLDEHDLTRVIELIRRRRDAHRGACWGFKDPRATLLCGYYHVLLPEAAFLFIHRSPRHTVDSLIRRTRHRTIRLNPFAAARSYITYAQRIRGFVGRHGNRGMIITTEDFIAYPDQCAMRINDRFALGLKPRGLDDLFSPNLMKRNRRFGWKSRMVFTLYGRRLDELDRDMRRLCTTF